MNFTEEHIEILEKHKEHWDSLRTVQFIRNIDKPTFDELQRVHNEAISEMHYSSWCGECVAEMIRIVYTHYDLFKAAQPQEAEGDGEKVPAKQRGKKARQEAEGDD